MKLQEHIDLLQKLHRATRGDSTEALKLAMTIFQDHYNPIDKTFHDADGKPLRMTPHDFLEAISTREPAPIQKITKITKITKAKA